MKSFLHLAIIMSLQHNFKPHGKQQFVSPQVPQGSYRSIIGTYKFTEKKYDTLPEEIPWASPKDCSTTTTHYYFLKGTMHIGISSH